MQHKLGDQIVLEVIEALSKKDGGNYRCHGCFFEEIDDCPMVSKKWKCTKESRKDKKDIIYKEVSKFKNKLQYEK